MRNGKIMDDRLEGQALRAVEHGLGKEKRWAYESCECVLGNLSANSLKGRGEDSGEAVPQPRSPQRPRGVERAANSVRGRGSRSNFFR